MAQLAMISNIFTDGACTRPVAPELAVAAWGVVNASSGLIVATGHLPGVYQSAPRAELFGLLSAVSWVRVSSANGVIWCDSLGSAEGLHLLLQGDEPPCSSDNFNISGNASGIRFASSVLGSFASSTSHRTWTLPYVILHSKSGLQTGMLLLTQSRGLRTPTGLGRFSRCSFALSIITMIQQSAFERFVLYILGSPTLPDKTLSDRGLRLSMMRRTLRHVNSL